MKKSTVVISLLLGSVGCGVPTEKYTALEDQMKSCETKMAEEAQAKKACTDKLASISTQTQKLEEKTKTYEDLVSSLKDEITSGKVKISEMQNRLTVNLIDKILFDSGSVEIKEEGQQALKKVADVLKDVKDKRIQVEGHTDNVQLGPTLRRKFPSNWELSTSRAISIVKYLFEQGVDERKLSATGYGEFSPLASNDTPEGKQQNRRIEIVLLPELPVLPAAAPSKSDAVSKQTEVQ